MALHIRQGDVCWLQDCPPLDDDNAKDRPVVVVDDPDTIATGGPIAVVACSTKPRSTDPDAVKLPDRSANPQIKTGLKQPCWAVPRWHFLVEQDRLDERSGYLPSSVLAKVLTAYLARVSP